MASVTIRNLPDDTHRALRVSAAMHGRNTEVEIRDILEITVRSKEPVMLGTVLFKISAEVGLTHDDFAILDNIRDKNTKRIHESRMIILDTNVISESLKP